MLTGAARKDIINFGRYTGQKWGRRQRDKYLKQLLILLLNYLLTNLK